MNKKPLAVICSLLALPCFYWAHSIFIASSAHVSNDIPSHQISHKEPYQSELLEAETELINTTVCNDYASHIEDIPSWQSQAEQRIQHTLSSLQLQGLGEHQLDYISSASGLGVVRGRMLRPESKYYQSIDAIPSYSNGILSQQQAGVFWAYLRSQDLAGLINAYQKNHIHPSKHVSVYDSPISLILKQLKNSHKGTISELVTSGILVTYQDLVTATELGIDSTQMAQLLDASGLAPNEIWYDYELNRYTSLANVAISAFRPELVAFWLKSGSPAIADPFADNALDILSKPPTDKAEHIELIIRLLLEHGVRPSHVSSSQQLHSWLSGKTIELFKAQLQPTEVSMPSAWQETIESGITSLYKAVLSDLVAPENLSSTHPCFLSVGRVKTQLVFDRGYAYEHHSDLQQQTVDVNKIRLSAEELVNEVSEQNNDPDMIVRILGQQPDLLNKTAVDHYRYEQLKALLAALKEQKALLSEAELAKQAKLQEAITEAFTTAQKGNWQQAVEQMAQLEPQIEQQEMLDALLIMAISTHASIDEITGLLEKGAQLNPQTILNLVQTQNLTLIKELVSYDLDLHFVDPLGRNALIYAVLLRRPKIMTYLLKHKVSVKPDPYGLDALDFALEQVENGSSAMELVAGNHMGLRDNFFYISQLLYAGAPIESSHRQRVEAYQSSNPILYKEIISAFPSFQL
ncbi:ankyrin repeat domain-containing protein [Pseudoalteromonas phenolica]|uniref:ankyrin repeat domain-containing protein n=1 Tax=Pseudoalteromonas phenolica TaxID=161398 RepID=UPI00110AB489|nr:ankyrin repeat domain-containing protein [Pseudoalteromonas phenolica]TMO53127.1 hypothetical protein CWC21_20855 [Pseudoalteromonas phenolica]